MRSILMVALLLAACSAPAQQPLAGSAAGASSAAQTNVIKPAPVNPARVVSLSGTAHSVSSAGNGKK